MREDKLRAEQERLLRLEREKKEKENEAKLRKVREHKHKPSYIFIAECKNYYFSKVECSFVESMNSGQRNEGTSSKIKSNLMLDCLHSLIFRCDCRYRMLRSNCCHPRESDKPTEGAKSGYIT